MRSTWLVVALLALVSCKTSSPRRQTYWGPPQGQFVPQQAPPPSYQMPFAVPAGAGTAPGPAFSAAVPSAPAPAATPEADKCLAAGAVLADCTTALEKLGAAEASGDKTLAVYKKACELKGKLLGCGAFKSTAVDQEKDKPTLALLAQCESGNWEMCEDVKTKSAPLQAWLSTLKTNGCKKGQMALCKNYRECKAPTQWGCIGADQKLCGCLPKCAGTVTGKAKKRTWPDGSTRGEFTCSN
ncbi:MAG: hypothetical protein JNL21_09065 [Myxococcales bacterium]|nr:hypothetical protein [Myxococcales bacterium]